jgi:hypothetical protein
LGRRICGVVEVTFDDVSVRWHRATVIVLPRDFRDRTKVPNQTPNDADNTTLLDHPDRISVGM